MKNYLISFAIALTLMLAVNAIQPPPIVAALLGYVACGIYYGIKEKRQRK